MLAILSNSARLPVTLRPQSGHETVITPGCSSTSAMVALRHLHFEIPSAAIIFFSIRRAISGVSFAVFSMRSL